MADRATEGQDFYTSPLGSAGMQNRVVQAVEFYQDQQRLGEGIPNNGFPIPTDIVHVRNDSGADRREGDVLEIDPTNRLLADPQRAERLWFKGLTPNAQRSFGILRKHAKHNATETSRDIKPLQVSGACKAFVNFSNADHRFAEVESGSHVLKSAWMGPVQILYKPSGTGEKECAVRFFPSLSLTEMVQVWVASGSPTTGDLVAQNADGYHAARVRRWVNGSLAIHEDCWLRFMDWHDVDNGATIAEHARLYHGKHVGNATSSSVTKPLYLAVIGEQTFLAQPVGDIAKGSSGSCRLYNGDETDSGLTKTAKALGMEVFEDKWVTVSRFRGGAWYVGCWEV